MNDTLDIAIVGGGAAGLAAAIFAAEAAPPETRIAVFDGAKKLGAKILVAGGGRCNVTHARVTPDDYNGPTNIVRNVLRSFDEQRAVAWFESMGVKLKTEDTGKLFPVTDSARTVLNALLDRCRALGVELRTDHRVSDIEKRDHGFVITHSKDTTEAKRVVLATGGRSLPRTGSDGGMYAVVKKLGHTVTATTPGLAPMVLKKNFLHTELAGVSHDAMLATLANGKRIDRRTGSLLWTHFGVSGPVAMDASRHWLWAKAHGDEPEMRLSLLVDDDFNAAERWLLDIAKRHHRSVGRALAERWPQRVGVALCKQLRIDAATPLGELKRDDRRTLCHGLTDLPLPVIGDRGWNYAEVTAGGVPMKEVETRTMRSRKADGLSIVGELLDVDGRIGGFNFQWAWATGYLAGTALGDAFNG